MYSCIQTLAKRSWKKTALFRLINADLPLTQKKRRTRQKQNSRRCLPPTTRKPASGTMLERVVCSRMRQEATRVLKTRRLSQGHGRRRCGSRGGRVAVGGRQQHGQVGDDEGHERHADREDAGRGAVGARLLALAEPAQDAVADGAPANVAVARQHGGHGHDGGHG